MESEPPNEKDSEMESTEIIKIKKPSKKALDNRKVQFGESSSQLPQINSSILRSDNLIKTFENNHQKITFFLKN